MKDARQYLNQKRFQSTKKPGLRTKVSPKTIDARKILNMKRAGKISHKKSFPQRNSTASTSSQMPVMHKSFSPKKKASEKRVEVAGDGNIWITSKARNSGVSDAPQFTSNFLLGPQQWTPANVAMDNLEHVGIEDVIDMDSLPPAVISTGQLQNRKLSSRSLAQDVISMRNTMVADQVASTSTCQNARVIVSNLQSSVSKQDLLELFGDIGLIKNAEITYPGSAVIDFHNFNNAEEAVNTYHNRLLDGQPMQCFLQSNNRTSVSQRLGDRIQNTIPSFPNISPYMASDPRSRYNPRDVRFTVKLA